MKYFIRIKLRVKLFFILTPWCFWVACRLIVKYAPFARGSGIPQVKASIELANPKHNHKVNHFLFDAYRIAYKPDRIAGDEAFLL